MNPRPVFLVALALALVFAQQAAHAAPSPELAALRAEYKTLVQQSKADKEAREIARLKAKIQKLRHPDPARASRGEVVSDPEGAK